MTPTDFGLRAAKPRHAALLDWLAVELIESGWSMKKLHRWIVTSSAYKMRSEHKDNRPKCIAADPENKYLWRMNARRPGGGGRPRYPCCTPPATSI